MSISFSIPTNLSLAGTLTVGGTATIASTLILSSGAVTTSLLSLSGQLNVASTAASNSTSTGSATFGGGIGVAGAINAADDISIIGTAATDRTLKIQSLGAQYAQLKMNTNSSTANNFQVLVESGGRVYFQQNNGAINTLQIESTGHATYSKRWNVSDTTSASSSTAGALTIGNGTAATNVAIGGGAINAGGNIFVAGNVLNRTNNSGLFTGTSDNFGFLWTGTNGEMSTASGSMIFKPASTTALTLTSTSATFAGTGTHLFSGSLGLAYAGTQKWHMTADVSNNLVFTRSGVADRMTLSSDGNLTVGGTINTTASGWSAPAAGASQLTSTATAGAQLSGKGSTNDITLVNSAGSTVMRNPTGTQDTVFPSTTSGTSTTAAAILGKSMGLTENLFVGGQLNVSKNTNGYDSIKITGPSGNHVGIQLSQTGVTDWSIYNTATTGNLYFTGGGTDALVLTKTTGAATFGSTVSGTSTTAAAILGKSMGLTENLFVGGTGNFVGDAIVTGTAQSVFRATAANNNGISGTVLTTGNGGSLQVWIVGSNLSGASGEFAIRDSTGTNNALTITKGTLAAAFGGVTVLKHYTVATLPSAASYTYGTAFVSDATNAAGTGAGTAPTGGGAVVRLVYCTGAAWLLV